MKQFFLYTLIIILLIPLKSHAMNQNTTTEYVLKTRLYNPKKLISTTIGKETYTLRQNNDFTLGKTYLKITSQGDVIYQSKAFDTFYTSQILSKIIELPITIFRKKEYTNVYFEITSNTNNKKKVKSNLDVKLNSIFDKYCVMNINNLEVSIRPYSPSVSPIDQFFLLLLSTLGALSLIIIAIRKIPSSETKISLNETTITNSVGGITITAQNGITTVKI